MSINEDMRFSPKSTVFIFLNDPHMRSLNSVSYNAFAKSSSCLTVLINLSGANKEKQQGENAMSIRGESRSQEVN